MGSLVETVEIYTFNLKSLQNSVIVVLASTSKKDHNLELNIPPFEMAWIVMTFTDLRNFSKCGLFWGDLNVLIFPFKMVTHEKFYFSDILMYCNASVLTS